MSYGNGIQSSHTLAAASLVGAATVALAGLVGPKGMDGRVSHISAHLTTGVTVAASKIQVGTTADPDGYAYLAVPVQAINTTVLGGTVNGALGNRIPADTPFEIGDAGGATAGVASYTVYIEWA
jgi:hypothetical protein